MMDNKLLSINGEGAEMLELAIKIAFMQHGLNTSAKAYRIDPTYGIVLDWVEPGKGSASNPFPVPQDPEMCADWIVRWLQTDVAKAILVSNKNQHEEDCDHDGDNYPGWRVFNENWGHVDGRWEAICAIRPCWLWAGK